MEGIFAIIGILIGFYLAKYNEINQAVLGKITKQKGWGEPFVVKTDEAKLEREQKAKETEKENISLKDYLEE